MSGLCLCSSCQISPVLRYGKMLWGAVRASLCYLVCCTYYLRASKQELSMSCSVLAWSEWVVAQCRKDSSYCHLTGPTSDPSCKTGPMNHSPFASLTLATAGLLSTTLTKLCPPNLLMRNLGQAQQWDSWVHMAHTHFKISKPSLPFSQKHPGAPALRTCISMPADVEKIKPTWPTNRAVHTKLG